METADSKASAKVKLAKLFTSEGNLDRSFTLKEFMESTGLSSSKVNVALFSLVQQGVVEQTRDSPPAWSLSSSPRLSRNPSIETSRSEAQTMEMPRVKQEPESAEFSLEYDLQTQISFLLNSKNRAISFDEICHFVARSTDDHQVVSDCLKTLEHYQLVRRYRDNPLLWIAVGNELATEHHYKPNECIPSRDTDESIVTVNQSAALVNLKDYPSPQGSPVDSKHESVHQNISSEHSSSSPNEDQNQEPSGAKETSRNILPVECNKERKAHQETEIKPVSSLKTLPPPPSSILFQNLKEEVPDLNPVMASGHPHVDLDNDATTQHSEEQSDKHTPYQEAYLILEMGTDYNRLMEDSYDDNTDNVFQEDEGQRECYKDKDEREIHQANLQQDSGGRLVEFLQRSEDNKLNNRLVLTSSENKAVFGHLNEQERKDNRPCTSFSDLGHGQKKEAQEDEGAPHREVIEKQQMPQLIKKLDEKTRMSTELTTDNPMSNLQNTNQTIHTVQSTVKKAPSSAPPPPSAALFQSLMSKCTRPPAPVVMKPAQSQQFHPLGSGPSQLRTPTSRGAVPSLMSLQVNKNYSQHHTSVVPYTSSSIAKGNQIRQSTQLSANSLIKQNREGQSGVTEFTSASGSIRDDTRPSSGTPGVNPSSSLAFTRQSTSPPSNLLFTRQSTSPLRNLPFSRQSTSPPSNFSSQNNSKSVYTAAASKLPAPPSANLFQNLVKRGPQTLAANSSKSVMSKQPAKLNAQESQLIDYMKQEKKPCQVLQLARVFGFRTKKEINPTLYHLQSLGLIYKLHDHPPTWKLRPTTGSYDVHPPHKPSGTSEMLGSLLTKDTANRISHGEVTFRQPTVFPEYEGAPQKRKWDHAAAVPSSKIFEPVFSQEVLNKPNYPSYEHQDTHPLSRQPYIQPIPSSGVSSSQVLNKVTFSAINKNPVSTLNEYAQKNNMAVTFELIRQGRGNRPCFEVAAKVGSQTFPSVTASNMKDARREAADLAMRTILGKAAQGSESSQPGEFRMIQTNPGGLPGVRTHFDLMAALSHHAFLQIAAAVPDKFAGRKVIACMIMKPTLEDSGHVVSLGAGNRCVTGQRLSMEGKTVNDSHAEIVSRRALLRFLYGQLDNFYTGKDSIFESSTKSSKLRARQGVSFHLYISTAPCGDGALFTPREISSLEPSQIERQHSPTFTNKQQGILRTKIEDGEGTIPIDPSEGPQTWDGLLQGCRLRTMSCSDKICRWNILGLQGSLLSHLIEPIYLESLTLGYLYDHGHLSRAVCCRLQHKSDLNADVQQPYHVNHPWLGRVTAYDAQRETEKTNNLSVNWTIGDTTVEVTDGRTGACMARTGNSPTPSRLCKASLYAMFKDICAKAGGKNELLNAETYRDAKAMATDFQETKKKFYSYLQKSKYGQWVSKPLEQEQF